jgi:hypothetical protein
MLYSGLDLSCAVDTCHPARNSLAVGMDELQGMDRAAEVLRGDSGRVHSMPISRLGKQIAEVPRR